MSLRLLFKVTQRTILCDCEQMNGRRDLFHYRFYGSPQVERREETWQLVRRLSHRRCLPWCVVEISTEYFICMKRGE